MDLAVQSPPSSPSSSSSSSCPSSPEGRVLKKKQKLSPVQRSWPAEKNKVCLAILCLKLKQKGDVYGKICRREYNICILDLLDSPAINDPRHFPPISPTLRIDCGVLSCCIDEFGFDAFCVLGQTLYMFEGSNMFKGSNGYGKDLKPIYSVDLSVQCQRLVVKSDLKVECVMSSPKYNPAVLLTPNSQNIVVFSTEIIEASSMLGGIELFDPVQGSSKELPPIQIKVNSSYRISSYCFIDDTRLLVQVDINSGIFSVYVLDLDQLDKGWSSCTEIFGGLDHIPAHCKLPHSSFQIIENRFGLTTSYGFHDLHHPKESYNYFCDQFTAFDKESAIFLKNWEYMVTLLNHDEDKGECHLCEAYVGTFDGEQAECCIFLNVCLVDLKRYIQEDAQGISKIKSEYASCVKAVQFCLDLGGEYLVQETDEEFRTILIQAVANNNANIILPKFPC